MDYSSMSYAQLLAEYKRLQQKQTLDDLQLSILSLYKCCVLGCDVKLEDFDNV